MKYLVLVLVTMIGFSAPAIAAMSSSDIEQAYNRSYASERAGKFSEAAEALSPVAKEYPNGYTLNYRLGYLASASKDAANALLFYDKAILAAPSAVDPRLAKMSLLLVQGKYALAEQVGYQILNVDLGNYLGNLKLTYALRMQQKNDLAEKVDIRMLALYPTDASFLAEYGILKYYAGPLERSAQIFQDLLTLYPGNALAKDYLALIKKISASKEQKVSAH